jgi:hypothetical protein
MAAASSLAWRMLNASMIWEKLRNNAKNPTQKDTERGADRRALQVQRAIAADAIRTLRRRVC